MTTIAPSKKPLPSLDMERAKPLRDWLFSARINARCAWQIPATKKNPRDVSAWLVNGRLVITTIAEYGWEIWTQPETNDIEKTLADVEARIGLNAPAFSISMPAPVRVNVQTIDKDSTANLAVNGGPTAPPRIEGAWLFGYTAQELACVLIDGEASIRTLHHSKVTAKP